MSLGQAVLLSYGLLMLIGGFMGYRAGSNASLIAGSVSGVLLLAALWLSRNQPATGLWLGAVVAALLCVSFAMRLSKTGKFMPSGGLLLVSVVALALLAYSAWSAKLTASAPGGTAPCAGRAARRARSPSADETARSQSGDNIPTEARSESASGAGPRR